MKEKERKNTEDRRDKKDFPGYPEYPQKEDIYRREKEVPTPPEEGGAAPVSNEEDNDDLDAGLDVPGAELDDQDEAIGTEDEENNYYSLGGDLHEDLEEGDDS